jgi:hypothetical protein
MVTPVQQSSGLDLWKQGVDRADQKWDEHDATIRATVSDYDFHLRSTTPGFMGLDWRMVKAMLWVESGGLNREWKVRPMQIGMPRDLGLPALLGDREGGWLILPPSYRLSASAVMSIPRENIRAGVGYLMMKMANFDIQSVLDPDTKIYEVTVRPGDSLDRIAKANGSTVDVMTKLNSTPHVLRSGQVLKFRKATRKKVVVGWKYIDASNIARNYNGTGDRRYAQKLTYAFAAVCKRAAR